VGRRGHRQAAAAACAAALAIGGAGAAAQGAPPGSAAAAAEARFTEAERLLAAGRVGEACAGFEASNALEPRAGTLINLGLCRERLGALAGALAAYRAALERVKDPQKRRVALDRVAALEPRVSRLVVAVAGAARVPGLAVARDGQPLDLAAAAAGLPVDGGRYTLAATAPGRAPWSATVDVAAAGARVEVVVPVLAPVAAAPPPVGAPPRGEGARGGGGMTARRRAALGAGLVGLGVVGGSAALGISARGLEDDAFALCPDPGVICDGADRANGLLDRAQQRALVANVGYAVGGAALAGAIALWVTGGSAPARSRVSVTPRAGGPGVDVIVRF
jgi:serine/threonine-protein kinase